MRIRWTPAAAADLQHINDYLKEHHPQYRRPTMRKLYEAVCALKQWPQRGRRGREEGTRDCHFPHYLTSQFIVSPPTASRSSAFIMARRIVPSVDRPIPSIRGGFQPLRRRL